MTENGSYEHIFFPFADIFWSMRPMNTNRRALCCPELVDDFGYPYHCHIINRKFSTSFWSWNITSKMQNFAKNDYFHFWIFNFWKFFPWQFRFFCKFITWVKNGLKIDLCIILTWKKVRLKAEVQCYMFQHLAGRSGQVWTRSGHENVFGAIFIEFLWI